jgi:hypothetical protein
MRKGRCRGIKANYFAETSKLVRRDAMLKLGTILGMLLIVGVGTSSAQNCLHGSTEAPAQKARRDAAIQLATRINISQGVILGPGPQNRRYRPFQELTNLPPTPEGFELQFHTDGSSYSFSIKDRLDPCRYVVFSDQDKYLYEAIARTGPAILVPLDTK